MHKNGEVCRKWATTLRDSPFSPTVTLVQSLASGPKPQCPECSSEKSYRSILFAHSVRLMHIQYTFNASNESTRVLARALTRTLALWIQMIGLLMVLI